MTTKPHDDNAINDDDQVIRRVNPAYHVVPDEDTGGSRTSSMLFKPSSHPKGGMSVDIPKLMERDSVDPKEFVTTPIYTGSVCFTASAARSVNLMIGLDPIKDVHGIPDNPYHGEVWASGERPNKFSKAQIRALAEASEWFVELPGVKISS